MEQLIESARAQGGSVVVVTGAGLSAASGIPTFRGKDGYWTVGSKVYQPERLATFAAFREMPREVWRWYLYRRGICAAAQPNEAHDALAEMERELGDGFRIVSQNVDGLHLRAGNTAERTYQIHGDINFMRCLIPRCGPDLQAIPNAVPAIERDEPLSDDAFAALRCQECGGPTRPHVLWFDECYDERLFKAESSLVAANDAALVVTVGTSGTTNLPHQVAGLAARNGACLIDINPDANPFSELAESVENGLWIQESAASALPKLAKLIAP